MLGRHPATLAETLAGLVADVRDDDGLGLFAADLRRLEFPGLDLGHPKDTESTPK